MLTNKTSKPPTKFSCLKCNFNCSKKGDYDRHMNTPKHKMLTNDVNNVYKKNIAPYVCCCNRSYKHRQSYYRHKKSCTYAVNENNIIINNDNSTILNLISQNKELMNLLQEQTNNVNKLTKTVNEMIPKIGNNNNNNTTNNNQFNLQVFLNEDCKDAINFSDFVKQIQVSFEDIENQAESGYVKGISKLFIENLQELGTYKRPIHCTDKKRKTLYIKENDEWDKEGSQDTLKNGIQEITRSTMRTLIKEKVNRAEEFADMESDFSKQCLVIQRNLIPTAPRESAFSKVIENITKNSGILE
jgi:hypothetical protein